MGRVVGDDAGREVVCGRVGVKFQDVVSRSVKYENENRAHLPILDLQVRQTRLLWHSSLVIVCLLIGIFLSHRLYGSQLMPKHGEELIDFIHLQGYFSLFDLAYKP